MTAVTAVQLILRKLVQSAHSEQKLHAADFQSQGNAPPP